MSRLEELIAELCPNGVERKSLDEIGKFYGGLSGKSKEDFKGGNASFITYKNVYANPSLDINPEEKVRINDGENQRTLAYGDIIFTGSSETPDECGFSAVVTKEPKEPLYLNSFCFFLRLNDVSILNPDYAKHLFRSRDLRKQIGKTASGVTRFNVSKKLMGNVTIPVPPLEVQREIVRILDNFTDLTADLTAELSLRKKQYEYYEHKILFAEKYKRMKLSELCVVNQGLQIPISKRKKVSGENCYRYITVQFLKNKEDEQYYIESPDPNVICHEDDILVTRTGSTGVIISGVEGCFHNNFFKVTPNEKIAKRYMYYLLKSKHMYDRMLTVASGGTVPDLPHKKFYSLEVPVPTLEEQKVIVDILERFNELSNDISTGLPAEIEARQKQYEYYRDKLLSFKEKEYA